MIDFLKGVVVGHLLTQSGGSWNTAVRSYEQAQAKVLLDIVTTAAKIEPAYPSPEELALQLRPLKMMFDRIDYNVIKSPEGLTVYQQLNNYFDEHLSSEPIAEGSVNFDEYRQQLHEPYLLIDFDGKNVSENNFYETSANRLGLFYCATTCGALHLFIPQKVSDGEPGEHVLNEMISAEYVIASICEEESSRHYIELLFEDNTQTPYVLFLAKGQVCPGISREDDNSTDLECQIHVAPVGEVAATFPLRVRFVDHLPYTKPWGQ